LPPITILAFLTEILGEEDLELTRQLFGGTFDEAESCAVSLAKLFGRYYGEIIRLPRIAFSKTRENKCDLTGCLIPRNFPYIAFEQSEYDWSHVSLFGFYRLLSLLCSKNRKSAISCALQDDGIDESLLERLIEWAGIGHPAVWRNLRSRNSCGVEGSSGRRLRLRSLTGKARTGHP
jgi:hypothetical protein